MRALARERDEPARRSARSRRARAGRRSSGPRRRGGRGRRSRPRTVTTAAAAWGVRSGDQAYGSRYGSRRSTTRRSSTTPPRRRSRSHRVIVNRRDQQADDADDHEDQADRRDVDALQRVRDRVAQDRADRDQEEGRSQGHGRGATHACRPASPGEYDGSYGDDRQRRLRPAPGAQGLPRHDPPDRRRARPPARGRHRPRRASTRGTSASCSPSRTSSRCRSPRSTAAPGPGR